MAHIDQEGEPGFLLPANLEECHSALKETQREVDELKDKYLRTAAEVQNVRKWTERDTLARAKEKQRNLLRQLLEVMDSLERALAQPADLDTLYRGVELTRMQLDKILAQAGVECIDVQPGEPFDPAFHEAVEVRYQEGAQPVVAQVVKPGYLFGNELLRPASVVVYKQNS